MKASWSSGPFPAQPQAAEEVQPGEGALDDPAQLADAGPVLGPTAGDDGLDAAAAQFAPVFVVVIAAIGNQLFGALARTPTLAAHGANAVNERQQLRDVVAVGAGQGDGERDAGAVDQQVVLAAGAATVNRRGPGRGPLEERECGCRRLPRPTNRSRRPR
jgi:hypothetical protein